MCDFARVPGVKLHRLPAAAIPKTYFGVVMSSLWPYTVLEMPTRFVYEYLYQVIHGLPYLVFLM